jgi:hypothetical protein
MIRLLTYQVWGKMIALESAGFFLLDKQEQGGITERKIRGGSLAY